ncbi:TPA: MCE family protein [Salmonella enterica subsp. enterica serovar Ball]|nr:MCE family protein [Salmonella enterica subsp. enterica serovar Ball]
MEPKKGEAKVQKVKNWSPVWIFPIVTALIGAWILFYHYSHQGPEVTLITTNAEGIEGGKTTIKSRSVDVGVVESATLTDDLTHVQIKARLHSGMEKLLHKDSVFWVVKPQVGREGISGLGTLLSGAYIELQPGSKGSQPESYQLLDSPPLAPPDAKGIRVILDSKKAGQLSPGDPVLFRGYRVGSVETSSFDPQKRTMSYQLFIKAPNDRLVTSNVGLGETINLAKNAVPATRRVNNKPLSGDINLWASDVKAISADAVGEITDNGTMASANIPGWWRVSVSNSDSVADFPTYPDGSKLYSYGYMFVEKIGEVWFQHYYAHMGANAKRQDWGTEPNTSRPWIIDYNTANKPSAGDVGALPITGGRLNGSLGIGTDNALGGNSIVLGDNDTGIKWHSDGVLGLYANNALVGYIDNSGLHMSVDVLTNGILRAGNGKTLTLSSGNNSAMNAGFSLWGNGTDRPTVIELSDDQGWHFYSQRRQDGGIELSVNGNIYPANYSNFDARYLTSGNVYTKGESDNRYVQNIQRGAPVWPGKVDEYGPAEAPAGCFLTQARHDPTTAYGVTFAYRPLQMWVGNGWRTING